MGGQGRAAYLLIRALAWGGVLAGMAVAAMAASNTPLRAMRWLAPGADPIRTLGRTPAECLTPANSGDAAYAIEVGRAAFRSPLLLGGQAARAGLSCESCHRNGRGNPDFQFPGVSGAPGTADVTSSLFSSHRGDGIANPVPIPDLSGSPARLKVSRGPDGRALERFIHGLTTEEFDGPAPPPAVMAGLAAYVRALTPAACPAKAMRPLSVADYVSDARRAVRAAQSALEKGDARTAVVMVGAARMRLGLIDERYASPDLARQRIAVRAADRELADDLELIRNADPSAGASLTAWLSRSEGWAQSLRAAEGRSLFDHRRLAALRAAASR